MISIIEKGYKWRLPFIPMTNAGVDRIVELKAQRVSISPWCYKNGSDLFALHYSSTYRYLLKSGLSPDHYPLKTRYKHITKCLIPISKYAPPMRVLRIIPDVGNANNIYNPIQDIPAE